MGTFRGNQGGGYGINDRRGSDRDASGAGRHQRL